MAVVGAAMEEAAADTVAVEEEGTVEGIVVAEASMEGEEEATVAAKVTTGVKEVAKAVVCMVEVNLEDTEVAKVHSASTSHHNQLADKTDPGGYQQQQPNGGGGYGGQPQQQGGGW